MVQMTQSFFHDQICFICDFFRKTDTSRLSQAQITLSRKNSPSFWQRVRTETLTPTAVTNFIRISLASSTTYTRHFSFRPTFSPASLSPGANSHFW